MKAALGVPAFKRNANCPCQFCNPCPCDATGESALGFIGGFRGGKPDEDHRSAPGPNLINQFTNCAQTFNYRARVDELLLVSFSLAGDGDAGYLILITERAIETRPESAKPRRRIDACEVADQRGNRDAAVEKGGLVSNISAE
jgi:hypothetical protein